jgi:SAM-dependent MidA family methyltransferase
MQLADIIIAQIKREGPVSFHDFMEASLYYPGLGYYTRSSQQFGEQGDYFTSPYISPAFGAMIARQLEEMWRIMDKPAFTIVEYGAGSGMLCHDILSYLAANTSLYKHLQYCIIEKSPLMREKQQTHLHDKVSWLNSIEEINGFTGCILSNELIDNFSVHRVKMEEELKEVYIDYRDTFTEVLKPAPVVLKDYLDEQGVSLPEGYRAEINLEARDWISSIAGALERGYVMTIDYGYAAHELYAEKRKEGTLMCYSKHQVSDQPYTFIGEQDITAHVNFTALKEWGSKHGLNYCGLTNQAGFLLSLGLKEYLRTISLAGIDLISAVKKEAFITRKLLLEMGERFKVLIQQKGLPDKELTGLSMV